MKLFFRQLGEGDPLIILHGLYGSSDNWMTVARHLSSNFKVVVVDQRNHGRSPHSPDHTYKLMVDDLVELFNDLSVDKATIIGHSMGGKVAMLFTALFQSRVNSLVVADILPTSYTDEELGFDQVKVHGKILSAMQMLNPESISSRDQLDEALSKSIKDFAVRQFLLKNFRRNEQGTFSWTINVDALSKNLNALLSEVLPFEGSSIIKTPTLFIKGQYSNYIHPKGEDELPKFFSNFDVVTVPSAGHWLHAENTEYFLRVLDEFFLKQSFAK